MCRGRDRGSGTGRSVSPSPRPLPFAVLLAAAVASAPGCTQVVNTVAGVFGPGGVGEAIDAHVVYRLRPGCPALVARTTENGFTVMTPLRFLEDDPDVPQVPEFVGRAIEETGLFEGPVRVGEVVFRYVPPAESETWAAAETDVIADVQAVRLSLPEAHDRVVAICGALPDAATPETLPVTPFRQ